MGFENAKLEAWKFAEFAAREIEREVRSLLIKRARGGEIVDVDVDEKIAAAGALRNAAHRLLEVALNDIEVTAKALHYRNVTTPNIQPFVSVMESADGDNSRCASPAVTGQECLERGIGSENSSMPSASDESTSLLIPGRSSS